ncbi:nucleotidyltransferase family protein [Vulcanisaeta thermophila]|uniref:nucleotidyltransferase family protein n=1 Tax=Vulcanisaeta thermophila TaxID=867917 RepID=UPI0008529E96|nr:nucleotidyltransferase family protein [Vulcanisaeta thermophila]
MVKALILAGGFGKRLQPLTIDRPKPLVEVGGKPILQWQIEWLRAQGIRDIVLAVGYLRTRVFEVMGDGSKFGVRLFYSVEEEPLGTGGAIKNASKFLEDDVFVVLNGDVITNLRIEPLINSLGGGVIASVALVPMRSPYGVVNVDGEGFIREFREKPLLEHLINAGVYAFTREIMNYLPDKGDIEVTAFPKLASERRIKGVVYRDVYWKSVDTVKDVEEVEGVIKNVFPG